MAGANGHKMVTAMPDPHVLIVGAGPTGLMLAGMLARQGVSVRLIERDPSPHGKARATMIQARTLERLREHATFWHQDHSRDERSPDPARYPDWAAAWSRPHLT